MTVVKSKKAFLYKTLLSLFAALVLGLLHVPTEAVGLVMGIAPILGMFLCMSNCVGDVIVTTIVAKSAGELDMEVYKA